MIKKGNLSRGKNINLVFYKTNMDSQTQPNQSAQQQQQQAKQSEQNEEILIETSTVPIDMEKSPRSERLAAKETQMKSNCLFKINALSN